MQIPKKRWCLRWVGTRNFCTLLYAFFMNKNLSNILAWTFWGAADLKFVKWPTFSFLSNYFSTSNLLGNKFGIWVETWSSLCGLDKFIWKLWIFNIFKNDTVLKNVSGNIVLCCQIFENSQISRENVNFFSIFISLLNAYFTSSTMKNTQILSILAHDSKFWT